MKIYYAPMQGVTGWPMRAVHRKHYGGVDRYFMPFISVHQTRTMKQAEKRDADPVRSDPACTVPQLLPGRAADCLAYIRMLREAGYREVNLNFGCPARTVTTKHKGAGALEDSARLDAFFEELFSGLEHEGAKLFSENPGGQGTEPCEGRLRLTIKTRIGMQNKDNLDELIRIFNRYSIAQLQVHARLGKDGYEGIPNADAFARFYEESVHPVCYNGDVRSVEDLQHLAARFPALEAVMIGRGLTADPMLAEKAGRLSAFHCAAAGMHDVGACGMEAYDHTALTARDITARDIAARGITARDITARGITAPGISEEKTRLIRFHDELLDTWHAEYRQEYPALCRMMEVWDYLGASFPGSTRMVRKIRKVRRIDDYRPLAEEIFRMEYCPGAGGCASVFA